MESLQHDHIDIEKVVSLVKGTDRIIFDEKLVKDVRVKGLADFVTKVDLTVQNYLQQELKKAYPDIDFIGEESAWTERNPECSYWILDPIDGTTNLIHHYQHSAVSLGLYERGRITFGVVYNPFRDELFLASEGQGAYLNGEKIEVSDISHMGQALVSYGSSPYEKEKAAYLFPIFQRLYMESSDFRRSGSAALDLCYVACGRSDLYLEQGLKPWDYAAGLLIVKEAGGQVDPWYRDGEINPLKWADLMAHNGQLRDQAWAIMHDTDR